MKIAPPARRPRLAHDRRHPLCPDCRYDLVATIEAGRRRCPECGQPFEMNELLLESPGDWTPLGGLARLVRHLALRGSICLAAWTALLLAVGALDALLDPRLPPLGSVLLALVFGLILIAGAGFAGDALARGSAEQAGFVSVLVAAIVTFVAWAVLATGAWIAGAAGLIDGRTTAFLSGAGGVLAAILVAKRLWLDEQ